MAEKKNHTMEAATALADLTMFHAIISLCESSLFSTASFKAEARIVAICKREAGRCLHAHDAALAKAAPNAEGDSNG